MSAVTPVDAALQQAQVQLGLFGAAVYDALGRDEPDPADRQALLLALAPLLAQAKAMRWTGLQYLFSVLERGLGDPRRRATALSTDDLAALVGWTAELGAYLMGRLQAGDCAHLLQLDGCSFWPVLPPDLHQLILSRLQQVAWIDIETVSGHGVSPPEASGTPVPELTDVVADSVHLVAEPVPADSPAEPPVDGLPSADEAPAQPQPLPAAEVPVAAAEQPAFDDGLRWVSADEQVLVLQALNEQVLPTAGQLAAAADAQECATHLLVLQEELALLGNAFEVMDLPRLQAEVERVRTNLELLQSGSRPVSPEHAAITLEWALALSSWVEAPDWPQARALAASTASDDWLAPEFDLSPLLAELARVRIGDDPAVRAARKVSVSFEDIELTLAGDVSPLVKDGMLRELPGSVAELGARLEQFVRSGDEEDLDIARRIAHTLKGDAHIVGLRGIANLTHALEDILVELKRRPRKPTAELGQALLDASDCVAAMADHVLGRGAAPDDALETYQLILDWANRAADGKLDEPLNADDADSPASTRAAVEPTVASSVSEPATEAVADEAEPVATMAVPVPLLDSMLQLCGEAIVLSRQLEQLVRSLRGQQREFKSGNVLFERLANQLEDLVSLRGAALQSTRLAEPTAVDPLELDQYDELHTVSRRVQEIGTDQRDFGLTGERALNQLLELVGEQERLHGELQRQVLQTRKIAVSSVVPRLKRAVRQTARSVLKDCELKVIGEQLEIDSDILAGLVDPLMHAVRNAVDHGIEAPDDRLAAGKPVVGQIELKVSQDGVHVLIELADDGRGLDLARIRAKAVALELIEADADLDEQELARLILLPGFSTRDATTQISGRGIGMDVVASQVRALKGTLQIETTPGSGTRFLIRVPADLNTTQVLTATTSQGTLAIATDRLERLILVSPLDLQQRDNGIAVRYLGSSIEAFELEPLCFGGEWRLAVDRPSHVALLYRTEQGRLRAVLTASVGDARTVIVSRLGQYAPGILGVRGATVLGDGKVAPVVDLPELVAAVTGVQGGQRLSSTAMARRMRAPRALVADDSLSVRRALEQLLRDAGFEVDAVRDGLEALGSLNRQTPDVLLLDLEMPKLNGLEVTSFVRSTDQFKHLPVVMITSRTGDRHKQMAQEAGVDLLLTKPYSDEYLLEFLGRRVRTLV